MRISEENRRRNGHVLVWNQPDLTLEDKKSKSKICTIFSPVRGTILCYFNYFADYQHFYTVSFFIFGVCFWLQWKNEFVIIALIRMLACGYVVDVRK